MSPSQQNGWLLRVQQTLCVTDKVNKPFVKENEEKKSKSVKSLRYMDEFFPELYPTVDFSLHECCQLYIISKYKATNCCKIEGVLKTLPNSQENPSARVSFLTELQLKKRDSVTGIFLRYYATFKVRQLASLFYKINTYLHWIAGRANILSKYIIHIFFNFVRGF